VVSGRKTFRENVIRRRGMYTDGRRDYSIFTVAVTGAACRAPAAEEKIGVPVRSSP